MQNYNYKVKIINNHNLIASLLIVAVIIVMSGILSIFDSPKASAAWYNSSWNYRQKIIIDHNKVPNTDQTDFPVLIKITDANNAIFTKAQDDGDDIRFTSSNETTDLKFEVENFSKTTPELIAWVKIPTLSHTTDTTIYLYYGNASAEAPLAADQQAVWSNGYAGVWHMNQAASPALDSTSYAHNGTQSGGVTFGSVGIIGSATQYSGSSQFLSGSGINLVSSPFTVSAWITPTDFSVAHGWFGVGTVGIDKALHLKTMNSTSVRFGLYGDDLNITVPNMTGQTLYTAATLNSNLLQSYYQQGSFIGSRTANSYFVGPTNWVIGQNTINADYFAGKIDEVRISSTARSADWIATEYANQNSPSTFATISGEVGKDNYTYQVAPAGWYDMAWGSRQPVVFNHTKVPNTDQTDFPALIKITDVSNPLFDSAQSNGNDILFADAVGNKLAHEIEKYDATNHELWAWVKIPSLLTASNTTIYMYYGNANSPNQESETAVWSNGYVGVWHMADSASPAAESSHSYSATAQGTPSYLATGKISNSADLSSSNAGFRITTNNDLTIGTSDFTTQSWVKRNGNPATSVSVINKHYNISLSGYSMFIDTSGRLNWYINKSGTAVLGPSTGTAITDNVWHSTAVTFDRDGVGTKYVDGATYGTTSSIATTAGDITSGYYVGLGVRYDSLDQYIRSNCDEFRISNILRSADWIATEYANQNDPATFETFGDDETADSFAPSNPSTITALYSAGGSPILNNAGSDSTPYYSWPEPEAVGGATDQTGAYVSGVAGYYSYFGTSCGAGGADPTASRGVLSDTGSGLHYSSDISVSVPDLTTNEDSYCLRIKTKDNAGNISTVSEVATYIYDTTNPNAPTFIAANPAGYSSTNSFDFTWPVATDVAGDGSSGIQGYQYMRGGTSGDSWSATQVATSKTGITSYQTGENIFIVRSVDNAGNYSAEVQTTYYYSNEVPTKPTAVTATPAIDDVNTFAFSWTAPVHSRPIVDYGYSINAVPTTSNLTWTGSAATSLAEDAFATQQGDNIFYLVAKDDSGAYGVDVANYGTATFNCTTAAPPIPNQVSIVDSSDRVTERFMLTLQWISGSADPPVATDHYSVLRSTNNISFSEVATTASTAYIDSGLSTGTVYYYQVKAVDNADSASASSTTVSKNPTGKYTTPPTIISELDVETKATSASITWIVSRNSTSSVRFGTSEADLSRSQIDPELKTAQSIILVGLQPNTKYYYQVQALDADRDYSSDSAYSVTYNFTTLAAPTIANVLISNIALNSADISWETSSASNTRVHFGAEISYGSILPENDSSMTTRHSVKLTNLTHTSRYHFQIRGGDIDGNLLVSDDYVFDTLPLPQISQISYQADLSGIAPAVLISWVTNVPTTSSVEYSPKDVGDALVFEESQSALVKDHKVSLSNMKNSTDYKFKVSGRDQFGNLVESDSQILNTGADSRPPTISSISVDTSNVGSGLANKSRVVISWKTDEPSTGGIEYDSGISGATYRKKGQADSGLTTDHVVVITDLLPSAPYHFKVIAKDGAGNTAESKDETVISGETVSSIFNIVMKTLSNLFGWISKIM